MYEVKFASKSEGVPTAAWAPNDLAKFACGKREAKARWLDLIEHGREGLVVEVAIPWCVEIVDAKTNEIMLSLTTDPDDVAVGAWANDAPSS
jgi:hypothetical protein